MKTFYSIAVAIELILGFGLAISGLNSNDIEDLIVGCFLIICSKIDLNNVFHREP